MRDHYKSLCTSSSIAGLLCILAGCSIGTTDKEPVIKEPPEQAIVHANFAYLKINGHVIGRNENTKIPPGEVSVIFDAPVIVTVPKEPLLKVKPEDKKRTALTTCLTTLPICPLTMMFLEMAAGKTRRIETKCRASFSFEAIKNETYLIKLVETAKIVPEIDVIRSFDDKPVAEYLTVCDGVENTVLNNIEHVDSE